MDTSFSSCELRAWHLQMAPILCLDLILLLCEIPCWVVARGSAGVTPMRSIKVTALVYPRVSRGQTVASHDFRNASVIQSGALEMSKR